MARTSRTSKVNMKYDLTDTNSEPSDEQLSQLMKDVAAEALIKSEEAQSHFIKNMEEYIRQQKAKFSALNIKLGNA